MAVTLTADQLGQAIKTEDAGDLARLLAVGTALVEKRAPQAPTVIQNEACRLVAGFLSDQPNWIDGGPALLNAYTRSGAASLCGPWRVHRAVTLGTDA